MLQGLVLDTVVTKSKAQTLPLRNSSLLGERDMWYVISIDFGKYYGIDMHSML